MNIKEIIEKSKAICETNEIEPNGYTDADGISYLVFHAYNIQDRKQCDDELPFPK